MSTPIWKQTKVLIPVGVLVVVMAALIAGVSFLGSRPIDPDAVMVSACKESALSKVKSPSTASFGPMHTEPLTSPGEYTHQITSWVDAQNGFGAIVRAKVYCHMRVTSDGDVRVVSTVTER
ncbi:hypothetical protein AB0M22_09065 [Nocardia sp. NPDC051756]|uniref:hypothetical protein n=1 Tax=Nocardia sp. NPDC051756 TaxID=3154751 RepID=UPI003444A056